MSDASVSHYEKKQLSGPTLRRVAGSWCIGFLRSVSCVWFDERAGLARPLDPRLLLPSATSHTPFALLFSPPSHLTAVTCLSPSSAE